MIDSIAFDIEQEMARLREGGGDHFYGAWSGGSKAEGGHPGKPAGGGGGDHVVGHAEMMDAYRDWGKDLNRDQQNAVSGYCGYNHDMMNRVLTGRPLAPEDPSLERLRRSVAEPLIPHLDAALATRPLTQPVTVWRAASHAELANARVGDTMVRPGFTSASISRGAAKDFMVQHKGDTIIKMQLPKGINAAYVDGMWGRPIHGVEEHEMLVQRGTRWRIAAIRRSSDPSALHEVTLVPE